MHKILIVFLIYFVYNVKCSFNSEFCPFHYPQCGIYLSEYYKMPALYKLDDYDKCMLELPNQRSTYCLVKTVIKPDNDSEIWKIVQKYSSKKKLNYRHEILERGICLRGCQEYIEQLDNTTKEGLLQESFPIDFPLTYPADYYQNALIYRNKYSDLINMCMNVELRGIYNLSGYSEIEYCVSNDDPDEIDALDAVFLVTIFGLAAVITFSTSYDFALKKYGAEDHYKNSLMSKTSMILVSFSLPRNWHSITKENIHPLGRELRFIQALRFLSMLGVISGHVIWFCDVFPVQNPESVERNFEKATYLMSLLGMQIVQTFFTISSFLMALLFMDFKDNTTMKPTFGYLWVGILYRYLRLTPVYAFIILLHATFMIKMGDGPIWNHYSDTERMLCRKNWWTNLLYINNYVNPDQPCVQQGWYLGVDFQLFVLGLGLLLIIWIYPKYTKYILGICISFSYLVIASITYFYKFEGSFIVTLDSQQSSLWYDDNYIKNYVPGHVNFGISVIGLTGGIVYYEMRKRKIDVNEYLSFKIIWYLAVPILIGIILLSKLFYVYDFEKPSIWMSIYSSFMRHLWGWIMCIVLIGFCSRIDVILHTLASHPIYRSLGRISYSVYLCHMFVLRVITTNMRSLINFNWSTITTISVATIGISCTMALVLCISIEYPVMALFKNCRNKFIGELTLNDRRKDNQNTYE